MITYPLNDIEYSAEDAELYACTRTSGVFSGDDFTITCTGNNNNVTVGVGVGWIHNTRFSGKVFANKSAVTLELDVADAVFPRIDVIAIRFDAATKTTDFAVKSGEAAENPVMPEIVQTEKVYELYLASVYRKAGAVVVTQDSITDLRLDESVCGLMRDGVTAISTEGLQAQYYAVLEDLRAALDRVRDSGTSAEFIPISDATASALKIPSGSSVDNALNSLSEFSLASNIKVTENVVNAIRETGNWSVDGVLAQLGNVLFGSDTLYRWMKKKVEVVYNGFGTFTASGPKDSAFAINTATSYELADDDTIQLINPTLVSIPKPTYTASGVPSNGTYFTGTAAGPTTVWRASADTVTRTQNIVQDATTMASIAQMTITNAESWSVVVSNELVTSTDPNAHYDGEVDAEGYTYTALDPITAFVPRIRTGYYVGTGTYGTNNPCTLTLNFKPKFFYIIENSNNAACWIDGGPTFYSVSTSYSRNRVTVSGTAFSWYTTESNAIYQFNYTGYNYYWVAIG